jgi:hypothetical protein
LALSGPQAVGWPTRITPPAPGGEQFLLDVVFTEWQTFDSAPMHAEIGDIADFLVVDRRTVERWIESKVRVLTFQDGGWMNLNDPKERFFNAKLRRIDGPDALITAK